MAGQVWTSEVSEDLRAMMADRSPRTRGLLRRVLVRDDVDRDVIASALLRYRDPAGDELADIIDPLTMYPEARRKVVRMLAEIDAAGWPPVVVGPRWMASRSSRSFALAAVQSDVRSRIVVGS